MPYASNSFNSGAVQYENDFWFWSSCSEDLSVGGKTNSTTNVERRIGDGRGDSHPIFWDGGVASGFIRLSTHHKLTTSLH
jgi:hypothetical protein